MNTNRKCKVLDIREFRKNEDYLYHIILKDLNNNKRFDLRIDETNQCFYGCKNIKSYGHNLLVKGDFIDILYNNNRVSNRVSFEYIDFKILENESEV